MKGDLRFIPTDCYDNFPQPDLTENMDTVGKRLDQERREIMRQRVLGLTKLYNMVHSPFEGGEDIDRLREIHVEIDEAVMDAYGWSDLDLRHGHHETPQGTRWTVAPDTRVEILDRLLELNFARHEEESAGVVRPQRTNPRGPSPVPAQRRSREVVEEVLF